MQAKIYIYIYLGCAISRYFINTVVLELDDTCIIQISEKLLWFSVFNAFLSLGTHLRPED